MDSTQQKFVDTFAPSEDEVPLPIADGLLDELADLKLSPAATRAMMAVAARGFSEVFSYVFAGRVIDERGLRTSMRRFLAVAWLLHSEMLVDSEGRALSLRELASLPQINSTRCNLSILAQNFGNQFGFSSRVQKRKGTKKNYSRAAKTGWVNRLSPTKLCPSCETEKPKDQFAKGGQRCNSCLDAIARRRAEQEREAAQIAEASDAVRRQVEEDRKAAKVTESKGAATPPSKPPPLPKLPKPPRPNLMTPKPAPQPRTPGLRKCKRCHVPSRILRGQWTCDACRNEVAEKRAAMEQERTSGMRTCKTCRVDQPMAEYVVGAGSSRACRTCRRIVSRDAYAKRSGTPKNNSRYRPGASSV